MNWLWEGLHWRVKCAESSKCSYLESLNVVTVLRAPSSHPDSQISGLNVPQSIHTWEKKHLLFESNNIFSQESDLMIKSMLQRSIWMCYMWESLQQEVSHMYVTTHSREDPQQCPAKGTFPYLRQSHWVSITPFYWQLNALGKAFL